VKKYLHVHDKSRHHGCINDTRSAMEQNTMC